MRLPNEALTLDFLEFLYKPRPYEDVMKAWRTSCPRLSVWEDALDAGLVERTKSDDEANCVRLTRSGRSFLQSHRQH